jgi:predicted nucleic acid-binding protein
VKVLVDTSVWSLVLRRINQPVESRQLENLILSSLVVMIGPIRQELLSGISNESNFIKLKTKLEAFDDFKITTNDYETAAKFYNTCRKNGAQGSHTDFLICAVAYNNDLIIYTTDIDFDYYAKYLPIKLLQKD